MRKGRNNILLLLLALPLFVFGQKFYVTTFDMSDGLPVNAVRQVMKDDRGFIWVATDAGLVQFDGKNFITFQKDLKSLYVKAFLKLPDGKALFANDSGVSELLFVRNSVNIRLLIQGEVWQSDSTLLFPNGLYLDKANNVWISQPNAKIARFRDGKLKFYTFDPRAATGRSNSKFSFAEDRFGTLWVVSETGSLFFYDQKEDVLEPKRRLNKIFDMVAEGDTLWLAGEGLYFFKTDKNRQLSDYKYFETSGKDISSLRRDLLGTFYLGTKYKGLYRGVFQNRRLELQEVFGSNDPHRVDELPFENINHIYITPDTTSPGGAIWLSTDQGLGLLKSRYFEGVSALANNNTFFIAPTFDGRVLISFGGVFEIEKRGKEFLWKALPSPGKGLIIALTTTSNLVWMSTSEGELFNYRGGRIFNRKDMSGRGGGIFYLMGDRKNNVWFCQEPTDLPIVGVAKLTPGLQLKLYEKEQGLDNRILVVKESERGDIYAAGIGKESYLFRYREKTDDFINLSLPMSFKVSQNFEVHDMAIDARGIVWLATTDGLLRYDQERIQRINLGKYSTMEVRSVVAMNDGSIWLATGTQGLLHYKNGRHVLFDESSGLPTVIASYRCLVKDAENRLWAGTAEGVVHSVQANPTPAKSEKPVFLYLTAKKGRKILDGTETFELPGNSSIAAQFISLAYPGEDILYQHRLRQLSQAVKILEESAWSAPSTRTELKYADLEHGDYRLEIRAKQPGGYAWSKSLTWKFTVEKVWYKTWWAKSLLILAGLVFFWTYLRIHIWRLVQRIRSLEKLLATQSEEMRRKNKLLEEQSQTLNSQSEEIEEAFSNVQLLHALITQIPRNAGWNKVVEVFAQTLNEPFGIDAFEFAHFSKNELHYKGYSKKVESFTLRSKQIDEKTSLASWAIMHNKPLLLSDFQKEHTQYVQRKDAYHFQSMIFVPFEMRSGKRMVLCIYAVRKNAFDKYDLMMLQVLADYLAMAAKETMGKG